MDYDFQFGLGLRLRLDYFLILSDNPFDATYFPKLFLALKFWNLCNDQVLNETKLVRLLAVKSVLVSIN